MSTRSHKYIAKIPVGTYVGGTTKYRYFYSMDEYTAYKNKGKSEYVQVGNRGLFKADLLGNEDSAEDFRLAGVSEKNNPYVYKTTKSKLKLDEPLKSPRDQLNDAIESGKEYVAASTSMLHTPLISLFKKKK